MYLRLNPQGMIPLTLLSFQTACCCCSARSLGPAVGRPGGLGVEYRNGQCT